MFLNAFSVRSTQLGTTPSQLLARSFTGPARPGVSGATMSSGLAPAGSVAPALLNVELDLESLLLVVTGAGTLLRVTIPAFVTAFRQEKPKVPVGIYCKLLSQRKYCDSCGNTPVMFCKI